MIRVKINLLCLVLSVLLPAAAGAQTIEKKGTTPYVTHFVFRPIMSIDIAELAVNLVTLAANWTLIKPAPGAIGLIPQADLDRAFALTAGGTISQYSAKASGTWGNSANWTNGVPDAATETAG